MTAKAKKALKVVGGVAVVVGAGYGGLRLYQSRQNAAAAAAVGSPPVPTQIGSTPPSGGVTNSTTPYIAPPSGTATTQPVDTAVDDVLANIDGDDGDDSGDDVVDDVSDLDDF